MTNYIISSFPKALSFKLFWCQVIEHLEFGVHTKSKVRNCVFPCTAVVSSYEFSYNTKKLGKIKNTANKDMVKLMEGQKMEWMLAGDWMQQKKNRIKFNCECRCVGVAWMNGKRN